MTKFYQVGIIENKKYAGDSKDSATSECRIRTLNFDVKEAAIKEYQNQIANIRAVVEFSKRHKSTMEYHVIVNILINGAEIDNDHYSTIDYQDGEVTYNGWYNPKS